MLISLSEYDGSVDTPTPLWGLINLIGAHISCLLKDMCWLMLIAPKWNATFIVPIAAGCPDGIDGNNKIGLVVDTRWKHTQWHETARPFQRRSR